MISIHANMASTSFSLLILLIVSLFQSPFTLATTKELTIDLIHRDSVNSPFFNPSHTHHERFRAAVHRSHKRFNSLHQTVLSKSKNSQRSFEFDLGFAGFEYLMTLRVGTPSKSIIAIADTGSDIVWTNCQPCEKCYKQDAPLFDPKHSSTYRGLKCDSDTCRLVDSPSNCSNGTDSCGYSIRYGDGSRVCGLLANETFAFKVSNGRHVQVPHVTFGCTHVSNGTFDRHVSGIVGLGGGPLSLVSQLGPLTRHKFSYCFAPYDTPKGGAYGKLNFGSKAVVSGPHVQSTRLIRTLLLPSTFFVVQLSGIKVGNTQIEYNGGDIIIDSGTSLTYLEPTLVQQVVKEVKKMIHLPIVKDPDFDLCFNASLNSSEVKFPDIIITLGKAKMKLGPKNAFVGSEDGIVCLNIVSSSLGFQLLGNIAQQDFHVGYDLQKRKVYFASTDCTRL